MPTPTNPHSVVVDVLVCNRSRPNLSSDVPESRQQERTTPNTNNGNTNNNNNRDRVDNDGGGGSGGDRCCPDCDRLARANLQLSRLLLRTAATGTHKDGRTSRAATKEGMATKKRTKTKTTGKKKVGGIGSVGGVAIAGRKRATKRDPG